MDTIVRRGEPRLVLEAESLDSSKPLRVRDYILKSKLGEGSFSTVWKAEHSFNGDQVALKQVYLSRLNRHSRSCLDCELSFLSSVNHPNIVRLFNFFQDNDCVFLVLEFCVGGNLASYIHQHGRVQEQIARRFMQQLGAGLEILQKHHIIHRDLKPEVNSVAKKPTAVLSREDGFMKFHLTFFPFVYYQRILHQGDFAETVCGSPMYMAPEVLQFQRYDKKADMWSLGTILFEILNGYPPFTGRNSVQVLKKIKSSTCLPFSKLVLPELHPDCLDMCSRLLSLNPANRLSFNEFYWHKFIRRKGLEI